MMDGILNINKPSGMTSHDVVDFIRKTLKAKKVGHTGTLDPEATGVLPICIGKATKSAQTISKTKKKYKGIMRIGIRTDSQDATGKILYEVSTAGVTTAKIKNEALKFCGEIDQTPPMFSAVKHKGVRLYKLARKGIEVERKAKKVTIYSFDFGELDKNLISFEVETSPGTYVRTLCDDIGELLGCGAHLFSLERVSVGKFNIKDSLTLDSVKEKKNQGTIMNSLMQV